MNNYANIMIVNIMMSTKFNKAKLTFVKMYPQYTELLYLNKHASQHGRFFPKNITVVDNNKKYNFVYEHDDTTNLYMLYDKNDNLGCLMILIDKSNAVIQNLNGDYEGCLCGSQLLKLSLKFLKENKSTLKINIYFLIYLFWYQFY